MMLWRGEMGDTPSPEMLAAYFDGELEGNELLRRHKQFVEQWLLQHPEAADLASWQRLQQLWHATSPDTPVSGVWEDAWQQIQQRLDRPTSAPPREYPTRHWARLTGLVAAGVAAVFALLWLLPWRTHEGDVPVAVQPKPAPVNIAVVEPLPVAAEAEVEIITVPGDGSEALVIGNLPLEGPVELAAPGDISLAAFTDAPEQDLQMYQNPPMIWARSNEEVQSN